MSKLKNLAKETVIYGFSSIVGKFLNWCLVPFYTYVLPNPGEYGVVTNIYAWSALLIAILTYGMETGFFRYASTQKDEDGVNCVYTTTLTSLCMTSTAFLVLLFFVERPLASILGYGAHPEYIGILFGIVAIDAINCIPFSYLRLKQRPVMFMVIKIASILVNILFNVFFLLACPRIYAVHPTWLDWFYAPGQEILFIFVANLISTAFTTVLLLPFILGRRWRFDGQLLRRMLRYSWPLLLLSVAGIMNQSIDKIIFPLIYPDVEVGRAELGIYGACFKIAMVMMMFTYAFRFAYEPFVFSKNKDRDSRQTYADAMKYFVITSLLILLGIVAYLDVLGLLIEAKYRIGLRVVPIVLTTYLFQGVFYNLSMWYKLTDKTIYGAIFSLVGLAVTLALDLIFIPKFSYMACAWASFVSFALVMLASYFIGQKYFPVRYDLRRIGIYVALAGVLLACMLLVRLDNVWLNLLWRNLLLAPFLLYLLKTDLPLRQMLALQRHQSQASTDKENIRQNQ